MTAPIALEMPHEEEERLLKHADDLQSPLVYCSDPATVKLLAERVRFWRERWRTEVLATRPPLPDWSND